MQKRKLGPLQARGWRAGSTAEFLRLTPEEAALVELRLALSESVRTTRKQKKISQLRLAKLLGSSQSRVAKIEAGDASVSLDLMVRSLLALGASKRDLARIIASGHRAAA